MDPPHNPNLLFIFVPRFIFFYKILYFVFSSRGKIRNPRAQKTRKKKNIKTNQPVLNIYSIYFFIMVYCQLFCRKMVEDFIKKIKDIFQKKNLE